MKIIAYLAFTILSVLIQFSLMDLIQNRLMINDEDNLNLNFTSQKQAFSDLLKQYQRNALYYNASDVMKRSVEATSTFATNLTSTIDYEFLLEEESSTTVTLETSESSTEFENITELSIFKKKNDTKLVPTEIPKRDTFPDDDQCSCDITFHECDVNCCCDGECTLDDFKMFGCPHKPSQKSYGFCPFEEKSLLIDNIDSLFCVAKTNLPKKWITNADKYNKEEVDAAVNQAYKWRVTNYQQEEIPFTPKMYTSGDPLWLLQSGKRLLYLDLPATTFSTYCDGRMAVQFLKQSSTKCLVNLQDLEMLNILKNIDETVVVTVTDNFRNSSVLNCSSLHCTKWKLIICNESQCTPYNKILHEPACTEFLCSGIAHTIIYEFYINAHKITNAIVYFYTKEFDTRVNLMMQHIDVSFHIGSEENKVRFSGNPGYLKGSPVIASHFKDNHTNRVTNTTDKYESILVLPENKKGICVLSNTTRKIIYFGANLRIRCRYKLDSKSLTNATGACISLWNESKRLINMKDNIFISSLGNPKELADSEWMKINAIIFQEPVFGQIDNEKSKLFCNNVVSKVSYVFGYADVSDHPNKEKLKIVSANMIVTAENKTFNKDEVSLVATFETTFVDVTKPPVYEYAGGPSLHINFPKDFFFPFQNKTGYLTSNILLIILCFLILT